MCAHLRYKSRRRTHLTRKGMQQQQQGPSPQIGRMLISLTWEGVGVAESGVCVPAVLLSLQRWVGDRDVTMA